jgi:hypothetical protein
MNAFEITRRDGRSNVQVILDHVRDGEPGNLYTYDALSEALGAAAQRSYSTRDVQQIVRTALARLLKEQQRRLHNVRTVGYRLAPASEHMTLARYDKRRADAQLLRGLETLRHVRWDEMEPNVRAAHEGHLILTEAIYANQIALDQRLTRVEQAIAKARN